MKNSLALFNTPQGWIATYTGECGDGSFSDQQEAHNIAGDTEEDRIANALIVWGANAEETKTEVTV